MIKEWLINNAGNVTIALIIIAIICMIFVFKILFDIKGNNGS